MRERDRYLKDVEFLEGVRAGTHTAGLCIGQSVAAVNESEALLTQIERLLNGRIGQDVAAKSIADALQVLVRGVIEQTGGKARAAFYLADISGRTLHHITGMSEAYARCVDGFAIGPNR